MGGREMIKMTVHSSHFTLQSVVNSVRKCHLTTFPSSWKKGCLRVSQKMKTYCCFRGFKKESKHFPIEAKLAFGTEVLDYFPSKTHLYNEKQRTWKAIKYCIQFPGSCLHDEAFNQANQTFSPYIYAAKIVRETGWEKAIYQGLICPTMFFRQFITSSSPGYGDIFEFWKATMLS